jgi:hypothetical protein
MADQLDNIVNVVITRQTRAPAMGSFSELLVADDFNPVGILPVFDPQHRVRIFGSLTEIVGAGFKTDSYVYKAAEKQFGQSPHIGRVYVGWKIPGGVHREHITISQPFAAGNVLNIKIGNTQLPPIDFNTEGSSEAMIARAIALINEVEEGLVFAVQEEPLKIAIIGAWYPSEIEVTGTGDAPAFTWTNDAGVPASEDGSNCLWSADLNWKEALDAIKAENNGWYGIATSARSVLNQNDVAEWIQANEKLGVIPSGDPALTDAQAGDIASLLKSKNIDRVAVLFHPGSRLADPLVDTLPATEEVPEAAWLGKMFTKHPGSANYKFKSLEGVTAYTLTQSQVSTTENKNANWYMEVAGMPITSAGTVASGEYMDVIQGVDWMKARIQNLVFTPLVQQDKVPYTDEGVQIIVSSLRAALTEAVNYGILADFDISYPAVADIAQDWKAQRTLPDVTFTGTLAGAINKVQIQGVVTL